MRGFRSVAILSCIALMACSVVSFAAPPETPMPSESITLNTPGTNNLLADIDADMAVGLIEERAGVTLFAWPGSPKEAENRATVGPDHLLIVHKDGKKQRIPTHRILTVHAFQTKPADATLRRIFAPTSGKMARFDRSQLVHPWAYYNASPWPHRQSTRP